MLASNYSEIESEQTFYVLVCEVALGNVMNSLLSYGDHCPYNMNGFFEANGDNFARGYHSVRVMGKQGPDFSQNWIQERTNIIWPIGDFIEYE